MSDETSNPQHINKAAQGCSQDVHTISTTPVCAHENPLGSIVSMTGSLAARLDSCPACATNTEVPFGAFRPPSGGLVALYKCTDCGHRWHTSWAKESAA